MRNKIFLSFLLLMLTLLIFLNFTHLIYFNIFTHSLPYGIYIRSQEPLKRGSYAASCLTREIVDYGIERNYLTRGNCSTGTVLVLKKVEGIPGDFFDIQGGYLKLNGHVYPIMTKDSSGRSLKVFYKPHGAILGKNEYLLLSDFAKNSWDSRYWGPVSIQFLLKPLWLFEK